MIQSLSEPLPASVNLVLHHAMTNLLSQPLPTSGHDELDEWTSYFIRPWWTHRINLFFYQDMNSLRERTYCCVWKWWTECVNIVLHLDMRESMSKSLSSWGHVMTNSLSEPLPTSGHDELDDWTSFFIRTGWSHWVNLFHYRDMTDSLIEHCHASGHDGLSAWTSVCITNYWTDSITSSCITTWWTHFRPWWAHFRAWWAHFKA